MKKAAKKPAKSKINLLSLPVDLPEPTLAENAETVLANRYLAKDKVTGEVVETPRDLFWRVASAVAAPDVA